MIPATIDPVSPTVIAQAQAGDRQAFAMLYRHYSVDVFRTAYLILGDHMAAEDVTHDVFVHLHRTLPQYLATRGTFGAWLHRSTLNRCLTLRRRLQVWFSLDADPVQQERQASSALPLDVLLQTEQQRVLWQHIQRLSLKLRAVIVLRYYHDLSYEAIAQVLNCPVGTVRSRLHAAHAHLRITLDAPMGEE